MSVTQAEGGNVGALGIDVAQHLGGQSSIFAVVDKVEWSRRGLEHVGLLGYSARNWLK